MTPATRRAERPVAPARPARSRPARPRPARPASAQTYRRRRIGAALGGLLLLVLLGGTARVLLYDAGLMDVEDVQVRGLATVPAGEVLDAADVVAGQPLIAVDTEGIAERVRRLPAVESAHVDLEWPHTAVIVVVERVPLAVVRTPQGSALVDRTGVVYPGVGPADLPRMDVGTPGPEDPATGAAIAVLTALPDSIRAQVRAVDVTGASTEQVGLDLTEDRQVRWGPPERAEEKVAVLVPLLTQPGRMYDVTSPELPTIRP